MDNEGQSQKDKLKWTVSKKIRIMLANQRGGGIKMSTFFTFFKLKKV